MSAGHEPRRRAPAGTEDPAKRGAGPARQARRAPAAPPPRGPAPSPEPAPAPGPAPSPGPAPGRRDPEGRPPGPAADRIAIRGLRALGYHGVYDHERRGGQDFVVDATLAVDTRPAAAADDLSRTVDYGSLAERLVGIITGKPVQLIETLAERLAQECLAEPAVTEVEITVHKPQAPVPFPFEDVAVTVTRRRA